MGAEITAYAGYVANGDFPAVQLFDNNGSTALTPVLSDISADYSAGSGSVRIGDWDYLSNGNIVIAGDSRQTADLVSLYGGTTAYQHSIYSVVTPAGSVVMTNRLVRDDVATQVGNENIWRTFSGYKQKSTDPKNNWQLHNDAAYKVTSLLSVSPNATNGPLLPISTQLNNEVGTAQQKVIYGKATPQAALSDVQSRMQALLDKALNQ